MMDSKAAAEGRENTSTPHEMSQLLEALYKGKVLNKQFTGDFFDLLSVHKESYIRRLLPEDLRIADKPGELEGVRNDCGIVFTGKRPYALCVMSSYSATNAKPATASRGSPSQRGKHLISWTAAPISAASFPPRHKPSLKWRPCGAPCPRHFPVFCGIYGCPFQPSERRP